MAYANILLFIRVSFFGKTLENRETYWTYIWKKVKSLLFPYFGCAALYFLIWIIKYHSDVEDIKKCFISIFWINTNNGLPIANAIWFLTALFLCDALFATIYFMIKRANICCLICIGVAVSSSAIFKQGVCLPWGGNAAVVGMGFYAIGHFIKKNNNINYRFLNMSPLCTSILLLMGMIFSTANESVNMRTSEFGNPLLFWGGAMSIIIPICKVSMSIEKALVHDFYRNGMTFIGKHSLFFLCFNQITIFLVGGLYRITTLKRTIGHEYAYDFLVMISVILLLTIAVCIISWCKKKIKHKICWF